MMIIYSLKCKRFWRKLVVIVVVLFSFSSCTPLDGTAMAIEICECTEKAGRLPRTRPGRYQELDECIDLMEEYEERLRENKEEEKKFNDYFPCPNPEPFVL